MNENRGTRFTLSRDELLTLPEFVLLSLFPNGLFPEGHMGGFQDGDAVQVDVSSSLTISNSYPPDSEDSFHYYRGGGAVGGGEGCSPLPVAKAVAVGIRNVLRNLEIHIADIFCYSPQYDPASLQYMLDFFRNVAQTIPASSSDSNDDGVVPLDPGSRGGGDDGSRRAGIIVLREDLDFYAIPHKKDIDQSEMIEVKRAAARALLKQNGIFSGLKKSDEPGTTEAHLIEMLTAG